MMKYLVSQLMHFSKSPFSRIRIGAILRFLAIITAMILVYSVIFHLIMEHEGRSESWITGLYWTLTVMSTLGFGDITFESDIGRLFSTIVLMSGIIFLLILLPFTFIEFFYEPWMRAQRAARTPTQLPPKTRGHVIVINYDAVTRTLIEKLKQYHYPYVLLVPELGDAIKLHELGVKVLLGDLDNPRTYEYARADQALAVVSTASDQVNANIAATVREVAETVPIIATANAAASEDVLELAGCSHVLRLGEMMGQALARRVLFGETRAHPIGQFDELIIAEAIVTDTALVGKTLRESCLRERVGINVLGVWRRGSFSPAHADTVITPNTVLVMAGTDENINQFNEQFHDAVLPDAPVIIIGGGRVGKATGRALAARGIDYRIVEKEADRVRNPENYILGDAAELEVLERAGIREAQTIIITTHDDDMNIYLTIYCRRLRADAQIISRAGLERNIATLHRSGADVVMSYASTGANAIINLIGRDNILMVTEGLDVFEVEIPDTLEGKTVADTDIRQKTGCTVIALRTNGDMAPLLDPNAPLPPDSRIVLVGTADAEERFLKLYKGQDG